MKVFKSKMDSWLVLVIASGMVVSLVTLVFLLMTQKHGLFLYLNVLLLITAGIVLPAWILLDTKYVVSEGRLKVSSAFFSWTIPVDAITSVKATRNPLSSPALSLDRLEIKYTQGKSILVSPGDKEGFLDAIGQTDTSA